MAYSPLTWVEDVTTLGPTNMNHIEQGIATADTAAAAAQTTANAAVPKSLIDALGDLIVGSANDTVKRLGVGSALQVLRVNSGGTDLEYATPLAAPTTYRKTTAKTVNTTVAATDLLNGEITVAAGVMGTTGMVRLTAFGDYLQNSGGTAAPPRFQLVLGGTTLLDTGTTATANTASATRNAWRIVVEILNLGATNSQGSSFDMRLSHAGGSTANEAAFVTGEGFYQSVLSATGGTVKMSVAVGVNPSTAVDTATSKTLVLNVINGSANAAYETKLLGALVEII